MLRHRNSQKADEDGEHDAQGDGPLRIQGFFACRLGGSIGSGIHTGVKAQNPLSSVTSSQDSKDSSI